MDFTAFYSEYDLVTWFQGQCPPHGSGYCYLVVFINSSNFLHSSIQNPLPSAPPLVKEEVGDSVLQLPNESSNYSCVFHSLYAIKHFILIVCLF